MPRLIEDLKIDSLDYLVDVCMEIKKWQKSTGGKIYIWGGGSVAYGVMKELIKSGILLEGFFVNIDKYYVDPRIQKEKYNIYQLQELIKKDEEIGVVIGHSRYELINEISKISEISNIWIVPSVVRDDIGFDLKYLLDNIKAFEKTYDYLADEQSRRNMVAFLRAKVTNNYNYILDVFERECTYFCNDIVNIDHLSEYVDIGAYDGKSIDELIKECETYGKIVGIEVQEKYVNMLKEKYKDNCKVCIIHTGISNNKGKDRFIFDDQSTCLSTNDSLGTLVEVTTIDDLLENENDISLIKVCIGNSIIPLIQGAKYTIQKHSPTMIIAAGIDVCSLKDYIPFIDNISGHKYKYYLRFTNAMTEALVLFARPWN